MVKTQVDRNWNEPLEMISPHCVLLLFTSDMTFTMGPKFLFFHAQACNYLIFISEIFSYLKLEGDLKISKIPCEIMGRNTKILIMRHQKQFHPMAFLIEVA